MTHESVEITLPFGENIIKALESGNNGYASVVLKGLIAELVDGMPLRTRSVLDGEGGLSDFLEDRQKVSLIVPLSDEEDAHLTIFREDGGQLVLALKPEGNREILRRWQDLGF